MLRRATWDERRERAEALPEEASSLVEQGFRDEANALRAEANELLTASERDDEDDRGPRERDNVELMDRLAQEVQELLELGRRDEAENVRARIQELERRRARRRRRPDAQRELASSNYKIR